MWARFGHIRTSRARRGDGTPYRDGRIGGRSAPLERLAPHRTNTRGVGVTVAEGALECRAAPRSERHFLADTRASGEGGGGAGKLEPYA